MTDQLDFDGHAHPFPTPAARHLTNRQRVMLEWCRWVNETGSPMATREARQWYADPSSALRRLEAMGLVRRTARGCWKAT